MNPGFALLLLLGSECAEAPRATSYPRVLVRALELARDGDPAAWGLCEQLEVGKGRGECKVEASRAMPDREAACQSIVRDHWRNECWFSYAEELAIKRSWDEAFAACRRAGAYEGHCARHLWWTALLADTAEPALRARLATAFPEHDDEIRAAEANYAALRQDMTTDGWTPPGGPPPDPEAIAGRERAFRDADRIDPSSCAGDAACERAAVRVFEDRWARATERNANTRAALCAGGDLPERLSPGESVVLQDALGALRARACDEAAQPVYER